MSARLHDDLLLPDVALSCGPRDNHDHSELKTVLCDGDPCNFSRLPLIFTICGHIERMGPNQSDNRLEDAKMLNS